MVIYHGRIRTKSPKKQAKNDQNNGHSFLSLDFLGLYKWIVDVFPIENGDFPMSCSFFRGNPIFLHFTQKYLSAEGTGLSWSPWSFSLHAPRGPATPWNPPCSSSEGGTTFPWSQREKHTPKTKRRLFGGVSWLSIFLGGFGNVKIGWRGLEEKKMGKSTMISRGNSS